MAQETPGQRIERARLRHHWSQEDLAAQLESSRQSVHRWERDKVLPTLRIREKLISVLDLPEDTFLLKKERQTKMGGSVTLPTQFISPHELAMYVQQLSPIMLFKGRRKTKHVESGIVNLTYVTLNEYPLPFAKEGEHDSYRFDWGYEGFAPRVLACSILAAYFTIHEVELATTYDSMFNIEYDFNKEVVAKLPLEQWELSSEQILDWLDLRRKRLNIGG